MNLGGGGTSVREAGVCGVVGRMNFFPYSPPPLTSHLWTNHVTRLGFHPGDWGVGVGRTCRHALGTQRRFIPGPRAVTTP